MPGRARPVVAAHLLFRRGDSILLLRRANTGYEDGNFSVPAGHVEAGENATAAAVREASEEVGLAITPSDLRFALVLHRQSQAERIDFFFAVKHWDGDPRNCEPEKCDELLWADLKSLPANMVPYVRRAIEAFRTGETFVEFGWD